MPMDDHICVDPLGELKFFNPEFSYIWIVFESESPDSLEHWWLWCVIYF